MSEPEAQPAVSKRTRRTLRRVLLAMGLLSCAAMVRPSVHLARVAWRERTSTAHIAAGFADDASRMNATRIADVVTLPASMTESELRLRSLLARANAEGLHVTVAGARHTMGGHTIYPVGIAVDMSALRAMSLDARTNILHVEAGAHWSDVIPYLDARGRSVAVMQSDNAFSIGGSLSANCHGWQPGSPPIASTVSSFRVMRADGEIVRCSRHENAELFSLVLGGYGLFGIILDVDLEVVANERYRMETIAVPSDGYAELLRDRVERRGSDVGMAYGRLCVDSQCGLRTATLTAFHRDPSGPIPTLPPARQPGFRRLVFRGQEGSEYGKELRWTLERYFVPLFTPAIYSRNELMNDGVELYLGRSETSTDILHEYFVPPAALGGFLSRARSIIAAHHGDLMNVTLRGVHRDDDSFLRYATEDMIAAVMMYAQPRTEAGDAAMQSMTRELIDAADAVGGRYYLPYRLHASLEQFHRAYPQAGRFFERKRFYDPREIFSNQFYVRYGAE